MTYRTDTPAAGTLGFVWYHTEYVAATFDGTTWRDANGRAMPGVTHWREV
jgi:hypothetical protein